MSHAVAYDVVGAGPPAAFVHGLTSSRQAWNPVTDLLVSECTCVRIDLRGHGESPPASDYAMVSLVADVRAVVDEVGLGEPAIVGHSLGASVAAIYGALHDPRAVICVDSSLRFGDFARLVQSRASLLRSDRTTEALVAIDRELGLEPYAGIEEMEKRILDFPREVVLGVWDQLLSTPPAELTARAEVVLPQIQAPLLSLHGSPPPPNYEAWLKRLVPNARIEVWKEHGHMLHLVDPLRFAERIRSMLTV